MYRDRTIGIEHDGETPKMLTLNTEMYGVVRVGAECLSEKTGCGSCDLRVLSGRRVI